MGRGGEELSYTGSDSPFVFAGSLFPHALSHANIRHFLRGFTPYAREDYLLWKKEGRLVSQGVHTQLLGHK